MVGTFAVQGNIAEKAAEGMGQLTKLYETQPERVKNACAAEQKEQKPSPEHTVDRIDNLTDEFHGNIPLSARRAVPCHVQGTKKEQIHEICSRETLRDEAAGISSGRILSSVLWPESFGFRLAPSAPKRDSPELPPLLVGFTAFRQLQRDHVLSPRKAKKK